ncbi:MAG: phenylacetate-CoA oxygenase subunit PaaJ [Bacteroidetes bacterium]|nr:MAG: phenylacetate-CoA oxygenase subunit PaaJ [Bacteroidota bacterium]
MVTTDDIWKLLEGVPDPEIPVLSILDLGIVRDVTLEENSCTITITPTYSGCPAMKYIEEEIERTLSASISLPLEVKTVLSPAWTTDWISESGRSKLKDYGIAPPENEVDKSVLFAEPTVVPCPRCDSSDTKMVSQFGSTACKAQYQCNQCHEPFDYFKCLK